MKILLVNPPNRFWLYPPLGLAYVAAVLKKEGHSVEVLDMAAEPEKDLNSKLEGMDAVGVTCTSQTFQSALTVARKVKSYSPSIPVVFGGAHPSAMPTEVLNHPEVDVVVKGEGEQALLEVLTDLHGKRIVEAEPLNIDAIPLPARELLPMKKYAGAGALLTSRGCPFSCCFCFHGVSGHVWRGRKPENVVAEIEELVNHYGIRDIQVVDDNFSLNVNRAKTIMNLLIDKNLGVSLCFYNGLRADRVDSELLQLMKMAGTKLISFGLESRDETVLRNIDKRVSLKQVETAICLTHSIGIKVRVSLMIGNPGDTFRSVMETVEWVKNNADLDAAEFSLCTAYPSTPLYEWVKKNGTMLVNPENSPTYFMDKEASPSFDTQEFPAESRLKALRVAQVAVQRKFTFHNKSLRNFRVRNVPLYLHEAASIILKRPVKPKFRK